MPFHHGTNNQGRFALDRPVAELVHFLHSRSRSFLYGPAHFFICYLEVVKKNSQETERRKTDKNWRQQTVNTNLDNGAEDNNNNMHIMLLQGL
jgi:hypothetical protein